MAWPTGMLSLVLEDVDRRVIAVKQYATAARTKLAAGNTPSTTILDLLVRLRQDRAALASAKDVPGIGAYAQDQKGDDQLDVAAEFNALLAAIDGVTSWITSNFPKDDGATPYLLAQTLSTDGPVDRQFTPAQTAGLRTALDTLIASIA